MVFAHPQGAEPGLLGPNRGPHEVVVAASHRGQYAGAWIGKHVEQAEQSQFDHERTLGAGGSTSGRELTLLGDPPLFERYLGGAVVERFTGPFETE